MAPINFNFISNNVKGLKLTKKPIKIFEYFKSKIFPSLVLFAQELIQPRKVNKDGKINWMCKYFLHGKSNLCGVFIAYFWE